MGGATRLLILLAGPFPPRPPSFLRLARRYHHCHRPCVSQISPSSRRTASFRVNPPPKPAPSSRQLNSQVGALRDDHFSNSGAPGAHHPWPEWLHLLNNLSDAGFGGTAAEISREDEFMAGVDLPEEFFSAARACLAFAIDRPQLLIVLPRNDVEIVVNNGLPYLFKNADDSIRRLRSFVAGHEAVFDQAQTIDLMRFILSYVSDLSTKNAASLNNQELVALSIRNLISALVKLSSPASAPNYTNPVQDQAVGGYGQTPRSRGRNIEMKRGDWICPRCDFMNFARNMKCLECEEARPKRQLTGEEWDCPQCNYLNNGRNKACLRCDCRHPAGGCSSIGSGNSYGNYVDKADVQRRLADNEEKAQRWFSKVSQLDSTSDLSSAIADEDFPEIMPLRKGVNRFVVSTRKTPLERRLANTQHYRDSGADGTHVARDVDKTAESVISRKLDDIMGRKSEDKPTGPAGVNNAVRNDTQPHYNASSRQQGYARGNSSSYVPFVPLPADMFAKKPKSSAAEPGKEMEDSGSSLGRNAEGGASANVDTPGRVFVENESVRGEKSEGGWFKRISDLHDEQDLTTANSDEDFPEIMPIRKGENRFVVSKNSNRSMTSPTYKRRAAMEMASNSNSNYVPFVPFPPDYFAKKENQQSDAGNSAEKPVHEYPSPSTKPPEQNLKDPQISSGNWNIKSSLESGPDQEAVMGHPREQEAINVDNRVDNVSSSNQQSRSYSWSGKSLEGSQVKEPDPLDMSEEAKAERWFRRVAQIKDISELSQIPDEDFPSIMPMRKGVNRFVVSKRKTPLERRLTSSQYRRNLPVMTSDPIKKDDNDNN